MSMLILLVFLAGAVLGMRFKVLILAPAAAVTLMAVFAVGMVPGQNLTAVLLTALLALVCLQIGYLGGVLTRYTITLARAAPLAAGLRTNRVRRADEAEPLRPPNHHTGSTQTQYRA